MKRAWNAIPFEYDNTDYLDSFQGDYNQGGYTHKYLQDLININSMGKSASEKAKLQTLGDAYEKLMANNDDILWNSFFGM